MISTIRAVQRVLIAVGAMAPFLASATSNAGSVTYVSTTGSGNTCTVTQPCSDIAQAISVAQTPPGGLGRVICLSAIAVAQNIGNGDNSNQTLEIDCPGGVLTFFNLGGTNTTIRLRNITFTPSNFANEIQYFGSGTLILENCAFADDANGVALQIEPQGPLNLVIRNSRVSNNASAILLKPGVGGSIHATLDRVTIANNTGGGIKIDTTNGPVTLDITDSVISDNSGNGINAVGGGANQNMVSIKNSVIAKNGVAGVQANGANAGVLIQTTLLDQNASGATSVVNGGHISTYGNNSIVGSAGSGFTGTAPLQ